MDRTNEISTHIHGFQANVCLNYGGREEILHAARRFARDCADGTADPDSLTEAGFSDYLYSAGIPDPELIIRTSGEERLSGFLLWQCAYSEFLLLRHPVAGLRRPGLRQSHHRLPEPRPAVRRREIERIQT